MGIIEITKSELIDGNIANMLIIEIAKNRIHRRPYWIYDNYKDYQNIELIGGYNANMRIKEMAKIVLTGD